MSKGFIINAVFLIMAGMPSQAWAQARVADDASRMLDECRSLFEQGDYTAAGTVLDNWQSKSGSKGIARTEETDYMRTVIKAEKDMANAVPVLDEFISRYPKSMYCNRMYALKGSSYFTNHEYEKAIESFDSCDPLLLSDADTRRLLRQSAISLIRTGHVQEGYMQLEILERMTDYPEKDEDLVFYSAFVDYMNGKNDLARTGFEHSLESRHADEARLYLADMDLNQGGDAVKAYGTAREISELSQDPDLKAEAGRIMGEYWYREGDFVKAAQFLNDYVNSDTISDKRYDIYLLGISQYRSGNMDGAISSLSKVIGTQDAVSQNAALHMGLAALNKGNKDMARMSFELASSIPGKAQVREQALYNYAMILHETAYSPFAESVTTFERFLNEYPESSYAEQVSGYLVDEYMSTASYDAALASIAKIKNPDSQIISAKMQLMYKKAIDLIASGRYEEATPLLTNVITLDSHDRKTAAQAMYWRGECYYRLDDMNKAEADYYRYLSLAGNEVSQNSCLANYGLGYIYYNAKSYDKAWKVLRTVIQSADKAGLPANITADAALRAGDCMFFERQYDQACEYYAMAMNLDRTTGDYALYQTATVNGLQRDYRLKINNMEKLTALYPESPYIPAALYEEGRAYQQTDKPEAAIGVFQRIKESYPNTDLARKASAEMALIYYQTDQYDEAIAAYKEVISRYPGSDEARTALADLKSIYVDKGDVNSYLAYAENISQSAPIAVSERDSLTYTAAESLFSRGDKKQAAQRFKEYLDQYPNGAFAANAWYYQGLILEENNDYDNAYASFMHAASYTDSRFCEGALDRAASMAWNVGDWETSMDAYIRLYNKTVDVSRQRTSLYRIVSSAGQIEEYDAVLEYADAALRQITAADQKTEVSYWKAKALLEDKNYSQARPVLEELSKDTRSAWGAESDYLLSQMLFDSGDKAGAEKVIMSFIQEGTPHMYWLARSFILLSDIYKSQGKDVEARQYLLSLKSNYTSQDDDIAQMIASRLE